MIRCSMNIRENCPRKCFLTKEKETQVKFNPGLSANRPSNNWALLRKFTNTIVNLRRRKGEERRRQTLCDKRDNNFLSNNFSPNFTFLSTDLFVKDRKTLVLNEDQDKTRK